MMKELEPLARRLCLARAHLVETLMSCGKIGREDADKVAAFYLKKKLAKLDAGIGRSMVKHGAYLDKAAIANAVEMVNAAPPAKPSRKERARKSAIIADLSKLSSNGWANAKPCDYEPLERELRKIEGGAA